MMRLVAVLTLVLATLGVVLPAEAGVLRTPAGAVNRLGMSAAYADVYGGVRVLTQDESRIEVALTSLDPATERAFSAVVAGRSTVRFRQVPNSLRTIEGLRDLVTAHADDLKAQGVQFVSWGPDFASGKLKIGVQVLDAHVVSVLGDLLGADRILVVQQDPIVLDDPHAAPGPASLLGRWRVATVRRADGRAVRIGVAMTFTWRRATDGAITVTGSPCTTAPVTVGAHRQTFGAFVTPASTRCAGHLGHAAYRFLYERLLHGRVAWRVQDGTLRLTHHGVGRIVLNR